jgi:hypothetical protein
MAPNRRAVLAVPAAAAFLLWPALWNGYPIVFADTGTYLSQAIHHYAGWDRPIFYSLFMLPLHATVTLWPVVVAQALLAARVLSIVCRVLAPGLSGLAFVSGIAVLSVCTWLPWIVSELMPDVFTPILVLIVCLLAGVPERLSRWERPLLVAQAAFMIASQQSSLPLAIVLGAVLGLAGSVGLDANLPVGQRALAAPLVSLPASPLAPLPISAPRRWMLIILPPALALFALCAVNLAAHGRFAIAPFGNIFVLARVIYDGPGMAVLRRDCPATHWRLCPLLDSFPPTSDDFLWMPEGPLTRAGGPKAVSQDARAIIEAALIADPMGEASAALTNTLDQLTLFGSGDGLNPWPTQVSHWIEHDFPQREHAAYASARQQTGVLSVPATLAQIHTISALAGVISCVVLLPIALLRRMPCAGFLLAVLLALPISAAITGGLSAPHARYQSRIMWLPAFMAVVSLASFRRLRVSVSLPPDDTPALMRAR